MRSGLVVLLSLAGLGAPAGVPGEPQGYRVVVHASNSVGELSSEDVARLFLKKVRTWPDGRMAAPVDQSVTSPVRASFGRDVLGLSVGAQKDYWLKQTLSGREVPPRALEGDAAVLEFVAAQQGGIAYVSQETPLPSSVRVLRVAAQCA